MIYVRVISHSSVGLIIITGANWHHLGIFSHTCFRVLTHLVTNNSRTFPGLSRPQEAFFQDPVVSQQCLNIATNSS